MNYQIPLMQEKEILKIWIVLRLAVTMHLRSVLH